MKAPLFSVVTVCLNPGGALLRTVGSVLEQTHRDVEIIVKDGGSKDKVVEGLPEDERITLLVCPDTGIYDAMNQAINCCRGEYVHFLNAGDQCMAVDSLASVVAGMHALPGAVEDSLGFLRRCRCVVMFAGPETGASVKFQEALATGCVIIAN